MTAEILTKYTWNGHDYCHVKYADGSIIELKGTVGQYTDEQWIQAALDIYNSQPATPDPMISILRSCSDSELVAEVIRRHLTVAVEGAPV